MLPYSPVVLQLQNPVRYYSLGPLTSELSQARQRSKLLSSDLCSQGVTTDGFEARGFASGLQVQKSWVFSLLQTLSLEGLGLG